MLGVQPESWVVWLELREMWVDNLIESVVVLCVCQMFPFPSLDVG